MRFSNSASKIRRKVNLLRSSKGLRGRFFVLASLTALSLAVVVGTMSGQRTYSVEASTWGGEITFKGELNAWLLNEATICKIKPNPDIRAVSGDENSICSTAIYDVESVNDYVLVWQSGATIRFYRTELGFFIQLLDEYSADFPKGSLVSIPQSAWKNHGALAFQGAIQVGGILATGSRDYLIDGSWEARQTGIATSLFRSITEVVKSGTFIRGSTVDLIGDTPDVLSYGHITPASSNEPGIEIAFLSERGPIALRVGNYGLQKPAVFKPDWVDTISSSPTLIALAILFSFIASFLDIIFAVPGARSSSPKSGVYRRRSYIRR